MFDPNTQNQYKYMGSRAISLFRSKGNLLNTRIVCSKAVE